MLVPRVLRLAPGLWAGLLWCILTVAAPAPFAVLSPADAGRVVGRMLAQEAWISLLLATALLLLERRQSSATGAPAMNATSLLLLGTMFCTLVGYFGVQPMMAGARSGTALFSFSTLHAASLAMFVAKTALVSVLAWRAAALRAPSS